MTNNVKSVLSFIFILAVAAWITISAKFTTQQILSTLIFLSIVCGTLFYWQFRLAFAFSGISILLACGLVDVDHIIEFAGLDIILFLVGMMLFVGFLEEGHFFEYLIGKAIDAVGNRPYVLMAMLMSAATLSAALVDEVTSILFIAATMFHLARRYNVNPVPFILMLVFTTNIGSSATAIGNPIGVMIALRGHLTFADFLRWASPISVITLIVTIPICFLFFKNPMKDLKEKMHAEHKAHVEAKEVKHNAKDIRFCWMLFLVTIAFLIMHAQIEKLLHLQKNSLLLGTALAVGSVTIFLKRENARDFFTKRVEWWTLTFFMALFASVGTLKYVGVTERIAEGMLSFSKNNPTLLLGAFTGAIGLLTGFMDNVLAVATFIPIVGEIEKAGIFIYPFWWGMLFGGTLFGNLTIIGSTANIVAMGLLEKEFNKSISFMEWLKPGIIVSVVTLGLAFLLIVLQIPLMPH